MYAYLCDSCGEQGKGRPDRFGGERVPPGWGRVTFQIPRDAQNNRVPDVNDFNVQVCGKCWTNLAASATQKVPDFLIPEADEPEEEQNELVVSVG